MVFLQKTLAVNEKELCKYFEPGNHVKVVSGTQEGATGMVVKVEQHVLIILSDTTKEHVSDTSNLDIAWERHCRLHD
jgi:transcription elongation factor SPT5